MARSAFLLLLAWFAGCGVAQERAAVHPAHAAGTGARLRLHIADADVWSFSIALRGALEGPGRLASCTVDRDGTRVAARALQRAFDADVALAPGVNLLHAQCRTQAGALLSSARVRLNVPLQARPAADARATIVRPDGAAVPGSISNGGRATPGDAMLVLDATHSREAEFEPAALRDYAWTRREATPQRTVAVAVGDGATLTVPAPAAGTHEYSVRVTDARGRSSSAAVLVGSRPAHVRAREDAPAWLTAAVVYGIPLPLYGPQPLQALRAAIPALADLGVTALWLSPLFESPADDYGYAVVDGFALRAAYGSEADLAALVEAAHAHAIRVLFDLVPNHTSAQHRYFLQASALGPRSHYYPYYQRGGDGEALHYFDWEHLPNLAYDNGEVRRFMTESAAHWLDRFAIDGYRIDVAWGVSRRAPDFFPQFSAELRRIRPELALLAESSPEEADPKLGLDLAYDWTAEPGHWAWADVFEDPRQIVQRLDRALARNPRPERVLRFLNNNDTGPRFITRHGEALTRVATVALLTLPGVPSLYAFDEVGAEYQPYTTEAPLEPPDNTALRAFHKRLIHLRRHLPALHSAGFTPLQLDPQRQVYAYARFTPDTAGDAAVVVLNFSAQPVRIVIPIPTALRSRLRPALREHLGGRTHALGPRGLTLTLQAHDAAILH